MTTVSILKNNYLNSKIKNLPKEIMFMKTTKKYLDIRHIWGTSHIVVEHFINFIFDNSVSLLFWGWCPSVFLGITISRPQLEMKMGVVSIYLPLVGYQLSTILCSKKYNMICKLLSNRSYQRVTYNFLDLTNP